MEVVGETFTATHGEYFLDIVSCTRCLCDNGQATLCEPSVCRALSATPTSCRYQGLEYTHGDQFTVNYCAFSVGKHAVTNVT